MTKLEAKIYIPLWVRWYIRAVALFSIATGFEPDYDKLCELIKKHMRVR